MLSLVFYYYQDSIWRSEKNVQSKQYHGGNTHEVYRNYAAYVSLVPCNSDASRHARRGVSE